MRNKNKRIVASILPALFILGTLTACGGNEQHGNNEGDTSKSIIYVRYFDAGFGDRWLTAVERRFEEFYKDVSFEKGKVGVDVVIDADPGTSNFSQAMGTERDYVYFAEAFNMLEYVSKDTMGDMTDALKTPLNESYGKDSNGNPLPGYEGETKSVYDKMSDEEKSYYVMHEGDSEKLMVVPYIDCYNGTITYNADLFEKYGLYYDSNNELGGKKSTPNELGVGPDGVKGTIDDGLPRTYKDFFEVCRVMKSRGITPFVWPGSANFYVNDLTRSLFAQNIGIDRFEDMLNGKGTVSDYIVEDSLKYVGEGESERLNYETREQSYDATTDISNFRNIYHSAGLAEAVDFIYRIVKEDMSIKRDVFSKSYRVAETHRDFIFGKEAIGRTDYGFLVEGTWWYNEAENELASFERDTGKTRMERNMVYMPLPKANEDAFNRTKGSNTVFSNYTTGITIKKDLTPIQKLLAETFIRFYCTNESLVEYNTIVSTPRGLSYTMTDEQYNKLSPYGKSLYKIHNHTLNEDDEYRTYDIKYARNDSQFYRQNSNVFKDFTTSDTLLFGTQNLISTAFKDNINKGLDSIEYYTGIVTINSK